MIPTNTPLAIFMESALGQDIGKMGYGVLRYSPNPVVCVIDSQFSGQLLSDIITTPRDCPIVESIQAAIELGAKALVLGIAPPGGRIPESWFPAIDSAIQAGLSLYNGLHQPLNPRYQNLRPEQIIWDMRQEPADLNTGSGAARKLQNRRILFVGTDMAVGKMTAGLELLKSARENNISAEFVATGQIGITITGRGIPLDAVRVDYASGAIERETLAFKDAEWIIVEGQGSIIHPGSTATLPLMRGSMPTDLILCLRAGQTHLNRVPEIEIPPINQLIHLYESIASACGTFPNGKVRAIAMNSAGYNVAEYQSAKSTLKAETGLVCIDPIRESAHELYLAIKNA
jgi:uncharacterized NAD-dependent epimerase/dehydratase family protein